MTKKSQYSEKKSQYTGWNEAIHCGLRNLRYELKKPRIWATFEYRTKMSTLLHLMEQYFPFMTQDDLNHMFRAFIEQTEMYVRWQVDQTCFPLKVMCQRYIMLTHRICLYKDETILDTNYGQLCATDRYLNRSFWHDWTRQ